MPRRTSLALVAGIAVCFLLGGHMAGRATPIADRDRKAKESFELLRKKLPEIIADWASKYIWPKPDKMTEVKLARLTGPREAKLTFFVTHKDHIIQGNDEVWQLSFYLSYFEGQWTTTRADCSPTKLGDIMVSLMLAIDQAAGK